MGIDLFKIWHDSCIIFLHSCVIVLLESKFVKEIVKEIVKSVWILKILLFLEIAPHGFRIWGFKFFWIKNCLLDILYLQPSNRKISQNSSLYTINTCLSGRWKGINKANFLWRWFRYQHKNLINDENVVLLIVKHKKWDWSSFV